MLFTKLTTYVYLLAFIRGMKRFLVFYRGPLCNQSVAFPFSFFANHSCSRFLRTAGDQLLLNVLCGVLYCLV